jgi:WD40 repeat protein
MKRACLAIIGCAVVLGGILTAYSMLRPKITQEIAAEADYEEYDLDTEPEIAASVGYEKAQREKREAVDRFQAQEALAGKGAGKRLPSGAIARLGDLAFKYSEKNYLLGFSPDGKHYYTYGQSNVVLAWDAQTGEVVERHTLPAEDPHVLAISPDVKLWATWGAKAGLRVRALDRAEPRLRFPDHNQNLHPYHVTFAPQNRIFAVADAYGGMRLYDLATGERLASPLADAKYENIPTSEVEITSLHFTPDGRKLIVCKPKRSPLIWDLREKRVVRDFGTAGQVSPVTQALIPGHRWLTVTNDRQVDFSEKDDSSLGLVSWGANHCTVRIARLNDMREIHSFKLPQEVSEAVVSADGMLLATLGRLHSFADLTMRVWDLEKGRDLAQRAPVEDDCQLALMPDNRTLVTCGNRSTRFWRLPAGPAPGSAALVEIRSSGDATEGVSGLQFTPAGQQLLVGSKAGVAVWGVQEHKLLQRFGEHHSYAGNVMALASQGSPLILMSDFSGQRWSRHGTEWRPDKDGRLRCEWVCRSLAFSPDGKQLAIGSRKSELYAIAGEFPATFEMVSAEDNAHLPIETGTQKTLSVKDVSVLSYAPDGGTLVVAFGDHYSSAKKVILLDTRNQFKITRLLNFPKGFIQCLGFSPDGHLLAIGGGTHDDWDKKINNPQDHAIALWRVKNNALLAMLTGHTRPVLALAFSPDGRWLVTGGMDKTIRLWDVRSGQEKAILSGHQGDVSAVAFSPDGRLLATGSEDTTVLLWDFSKVIARAR